MSSQSIAIILAMVTGIAGINLIRKYGIYPLPYAALAFIEIGLICGAIEKS